MATWLGGNGSFNDPTKWSTGSVPSGGDADITAGGTYTVTATVNNGLSTLTTAAGVTLELSAGMGMTFGTNAGTIRAVGAASLNIGNTFANTGTITETGGAALSLNGFFNNSGGGNAGRIVADGAGSMLNLNSGFEMRGGTLSAINGGEVHVKTSAIIDGSYSGAPVTLNGPIFVDSGWSLNLIGSIANTGTIAVATQLSANSGPGLTLSGGGTIALSSGSTLYQNGGTFHNVDNAIRGAGTIGINTTMISDAGSVIDATGTITLGSNEVSNAGRIGSSGTGRLSFTGSSIANSGIVEFAGTGGGSSQQLSAGVITNSGSITAASTGTVNVNATTLTNTGTISETGGGTLNLGGFVNNSGGGNAGRIVADGAGSMVNLISSFEMRGGTLSASNGGEVHVKSSASFDGSFSGAPVTLNGPVFVDSGWTLGLNGSIVNHGTIAVTTGLTANSGTGVELSGGGTIALSSGSTFTQSGATFRNVDNTIRGAGTIAINSTMIGDAGSVIDATGTITLGSSVVTNAGRIGSSGTGRLVFTGSSIANSGAIEFAGTGGGSTQQVSAGSITNSGSITAASTGTVNVNATTLINTGTISETGGGTLSVSGFVNNSGGGNAGRIAATGAGSVVNLASGFEMRGGTLSATSGAEVHAKASTTFDGSSTGAPVTLNGPIVVESGWTLSLTGSIVNTGTISVATALNASSSAGIDLSGGGTILMSSGSTFTQNGATFHNVDNAIRGAGAIAINTTMIDDAGSNIDATGVLSLTGGTGAVTNAGRIGSSGTGRLTFSVASIVNSGLIEFAGTGSGSAQQATAGMMTNSGTITATSTGTVNIGATTLTNSGVISETGGGTLNLSGFVNNSGTAAIIADGAGSVVRLLNAEIRGGAVSADHGGSIRIAAGTPTTTILDGSFVGKPVHLDGPVFVEDGAWLRLAGTIVNDGTLSMGQAGGVMQLEGSNPVVLEGDGVFHLINGVAVHGGPALDNYITIEGSAQITTGIVNEACAVIDANASSLMYLGYSSTAIGLANHGVIKSTGAGGLNLHLSTTDNTGKILFNGAQASTMTYGPMTNSGKIKALNATSVTLSGDMVNTGTIAECGGGTLSLTGVVDNTAGGNAGKIIADGVGSVVKLTAVEIDGGTLSATNGGEFHTEAWFANVVLNGVTAPVHLDGKLVVNDTSWLGLTGSIVNTGTIEMRGVLYSNTAQGVTLSGGGTLMIDQQLDGAVRHSGAVFRNVDNLITNAPGTVGTVDFIVGQYGTLLNEAAGVINATAVMSFGPSSAGAGTLINHGLIESTGTGGLKIGVGEFNNTLSILYAGTGGGGTQTLHVIGQGYNSGTIADTTAGLVQIGVGDPQTGFGSGIAGTIHNTGVITSGGGGTMEIGGLGSIDNTGVIAADGGNITAYIDLYGGGTTTVGHGSRLTLNAGSDNDVNFGEATGILQLNNAGIFTGELNDFAADDALDLRNLAFGVGSSASYSSGVLTVTNGTTSYNFTLNGSYSGVTFTVSNDGFGGTLVNDDAAVFGTAGNDTLTASASHTTLVGMGGTDTYAVPALGSGTTVIENGLASGANSPAGHLKFGASIDENELWFDRVDDNGAISATGDDLRITVMGSSQSVLIDEWFNPATPFAKLSDIAVNDHNLQLDSGLNALISAMATFGANYQSTFGVAFDPTAVSNITDTTVLAAVSGNWH